jgi:hypothetical protein
MLLLKQPLSRTTVGSIALAFAGVIVLSLAGSEVDDGGGASNRFLGDVVMMGGTSLLVCHLCSAPHVRLSPQTPARIMTTIMLKSCSNHAENLRRRRVGTVRGRVQDGPSRGARRYPRRTRPCHCGLLGPPNAPPPPTSIIRFPRRFSTTRH